MSKPNQSRKGQRGSFLGNMRKGSFFSRKGSFSASKKGEKQLLGQNLLDHFHEMDKRDNDNTDRIHEVRQLVKEGLVSEETYDKIVREAKEKQLKLYRNKETIEEWVEKPLLQGYLHHRILVKKNTWKWRKLYFSLYRSKLSWTKNKKSPKKRGEIKLTVDCDLEELLPQAREKGSNKHQMRHAFELKTPTMSWQFAAETDALKKYWFHLIGLSLKQILERSTQRDKPVFLTTRPKLQQKPDHVNASLREYHYRSSIENFSRMSTASVHQNRSEIQKRRRREERTKEAMVDAILENEMSVSQREPNDYDDDDDLRSGQASSRPHMRVQYVTKKALMRNPKLLEDSADDSGKLPMLSVGNEVLIDKNTSKSTSNFHEVQNVRSRAQLEPKASTVKPEEIAVGKDLGIKLRTNSFQQGITVSLETLKTKLKTQRKKLKRAAEELEKVSAREADLERQVEEDPENVELLKQWEEAKKLELKRRELVGARTLKVERIRELYQAKKVALEESRVSTQIVKQVAKKKDEGGDLRTAAKEVLQATISEEEELLKKSAEAKKKVKAAQTKEMKLMEHEELSIALRRNAATRSLEIKADELLALARKKRKEAQNERLALEQEWSELVDQSMNARLRTIKIEKALEAGKSKQQLQQMINDDQEAVEELAKKTVNQSNILHTKSSMRLADFIAANQENKEVEDDAKTPELVEEENNRAAFTPPGLKPPTAQEKEERNWGDYTESYYSDEPAPEVAVDPSEEQEYFNNKTKSVDPQQQERLASIWRQQEVERLCEVIKSVGQVDDLGNVLITYGELAEAYASVSDGLNGLLVRAKAAGRVDYQGDYLLHDEAQDTVITLLIAE